MFKKIGFALVLILFIAANNFAVKKNTNIDLFNGKDFTGWQKYLAVPDKSVVVDWPKNEKGEYSKPLGFDNDPLNNFTVVTEDGQAAIKVNGEVFGHIRTTGEYENCHISLQFKWGKKQYAPRLDKKRDAGLLYHSVDVPKGTAPWSQSQECQIQEGDCGDYYVIGGSTIEIRTDTTQKPARYIPEGQLVTFDNKLKRGSCKKSADFEKPNGEWNTIEIYTIGDKSLHVVNGNVVMALQNSKMRNEKG